MFRLARAIILSVLVAVPAAFALAWWLLDASLPRLDGEIVTHGLAREAVIERDALGVPTVTAPDERSLAFATGFVHAQDRLFQMDLARRQAAGELAALFGQAAVPADRRARLHRFRSRAVAVLAAEPAERRALLEAYAAGVNAAIAAAPARGFEYLLLRRQPEPWRAEDSVLVLFSMFLQLNDARGERELERARFLASLPGEVVGFLYPPGTRWDAPLQGQPGRVPPVPGPEAFDTRGLEPVAQVVDLGDFEALPGSNSWAVAGPASADGRAIVANDMHLPLRVPNVFYRIRLRGPSRHATGVSLPGVPAIVAGSNGRVAWGFTNSYGDWTDLVVVETIPGDPDRYTTPDGPRAFERFEEKIEIAGGETVTEEIVATVWGPLVGTDPDGRSLALKWLAHEPAGVNLGLVDLMGTASLEEAMEVANRAGIPPQNFVAADSAGRIGWTLAGRIPLRAGFDPSRPAAWAERGTGWVGWVDAQDYPRILDPVEGRLWTANARILDGAALQLIGDGGYALGARAGQIRDSLFARSSFAEPDMLAVQLDDRGLLYERWRELAFEVASASPGVVAPGFAELLGEGPLEAVPSSAAFRIAFEFREEVVRDMFAAFLAALPASEGPDPRPSQQFEGVAWRLIEARPPHLVNPAYADWDEQLAAALVRVAERAGGRPEAYVWGQRNRAGIRHPLSFAVPILSPLLDMPDEPLAGAVHVPRVMVTGFGPSERFAVSPGREEEGYFHMPGGQSGHPLSEWYRAGHAAWVEGAPTPFLPGPAEHRLSLVPGR